MGTGQLDNWAMEPRPILKIRLVQSAMKWWPDNLKSLAFGEPWNCSPSAKIAMP
jgi:hypothetical protein